MRRNWTETGSNGNEWAEGILRTRGKDHQHEKKQYAPASLHPDLYGNSEKSCAERPTEITTEKRDQHRLGKEEDALIKCETWAFVHEWFILSPRNQDPELLKPGISSRLQAKLEESTTRHI